MEDAKLDILIGKGPTARSIRLDLPKFTLVGATTRTGLVSGPLRDRFGFVGRLDLYAPGRPAGHRGAVGPDPARRGRRRRGDPDCRAGPGHAPGGQPRCCAGCATSPRCGATAPSTAPRPARASTSSGWTSWAWTRWTGPSSMTLCDRFGGQPVGPDHPGAVRGRGDRHHRGRLRALPPAVRADPAHGPGPGARRRGPGPTSAGRRRAGQRSALSTT